MRLDRAVRRAHGGQHHQAVLDRHQAVVQALGDEDRRRVGIDQPLVRPRLHRRLGRIGAEQQRQAGGVGQRRQHGDDRIDQGGEGGLGRLGVGAVDRRIGLPRVLVGQAGAQMAAGGEAQHPDAARIDAKFGGAGADQAHGALDVLQRHNGGFGPPLGGQAVGQHEDGDAVLVEAPRRRRAFQLHRQHGVAAAGTDDDGRAIGAGGAVDAQRRRRNPARLARRLGRRTRRRRAASQVGRRSGPQQQGLVGRQHGQAGRRIGCGRGGASWNLGASLAGRQQQPGAGQQAAAVEQGGFALVWCLARRHTIAPIPARITA